MDGRYWSKRINWGGRENRSMRMGTQGEADKIKGHFGSDIDP